MVFWWTQAAWATCFGPVPCQVTRVDAACTPIDGPAAAGEPLYLTAICVEAVCCAGSTESCSTSTRPFEAPVWHKDGEVWVRSDVAITQAGSCDQVPRFVVAPPGGHIRVDALTVWVDGELPQVDTPWPPGFPAFSDGVHRRVLAPEGSATLEVEGLTQALWDAGWDAGYVRAVHEDILVRFTDGGFTWQTLDLPKTDEPCPDGTEPIERKGDTGPERVCARPDGVLDGPFIGASSRGWYADGELDRDWLAWPQGTFDIRSYRRGVPVRHWESGGSPSFSEGHYVDGGKDGLWTEQIWRPTGAEIEETVWCKGMRCGSFRREAKDGVETGTYAEDQKQGLWQKTYGDVVLFEGHYDHGHPIGVHRTFGSDGLLYAVSRYDAEGRKHGVWTKYDYGKRIRQEIWVHDTLRKRREWTKDEWGRRIRDRSHR